MAAFTQGRAAMWIDGVGWAPPLRQKTLIIFRRLDRLGTVGQTAGRHRPEYRHAPVARAKSPTIEWIEGSALDLPFRGKHF